MDLPDLPLPDVRAQLLELYGSRESATPRVAALIARLPAAERGTWRTLSDLGHNHPGQDDELVDLDAFASWATRQDDR